MDLSQISQFIIAVVIIVGYIVTYTLGKPSDVLAVAVGAIVSYFFIGISNRSKIAEQDNKINQVATAAITTSDNKV